MDNEGTTLPENIRVEDIPGILCKAIADATNKNFPCFCGDNPMYSLSRHQFLSTYERKILMDAVEAITTLVTND